MKYLKNLLKPKKLLVGTALAGALLFPNYNQAHAYSDDACRKTVGLNGLFQGVIGGIGGVQNGVPFWKSFYKSMIGGAFQGIGKCMVAKDLDNAWPAKVVNAFGTSVSDNISQGKDMFDTFGIDYGPAYFEWNKKDGLETYLLPESLGSIALSISKGYKFDAKKTLKYGTPYFTADDLGIIPGTERTMKGMTSTNVIIALEDVSDDTISHESIHAYQYSSSSSIGHIVLNYTGDPSPKWIYLPKVVGWGAVALPQVFLDYEDRPIEREAYRLTRN
jgi:hypothetical protein